MPNFGTIFGCLPYAIRSVALRISATSANTLLFTSIFSEGLRFLLRFQSLTFPGCNTFVRARTAGHFRHSGRQAPWDGFFEKARTEERSCMHACRLSRMYFANISRVRISC